MKLKSFLMSWAVVMFHRDGEPNKIYPPLEGSSCGPKCIYTAEGALNFTQKVTIFVCSANSTNPACEEKEEKKQHD